MNEQTNDTLQDQILKILFAEGLGEGLANIAQILMNAAMLIERENPSGSDLTNAASSAMAGCGRGFGGKHEERS